MYTRRALEAGVAAGGVVAILTWLAYAMRLFPIHVAMTLGTLVVRPPGVAAWMVGLLMHLTISGLVGLVYAAVFEHLLHRAGPGAGALVSVVHAVATGLALGLLPRVHPLIPEVSAAPGAFFSNLPTGVVTVFALHLVYGIMVGTLYGRVSTAGG